jgi:hypothetical protein
MDIMLWLFSRLTLYCGTRTMSCRTILRGTGKWRQACLTQTSRQIWHIQTRIMYCINYLQNRHFWVPCPQYYSITKEGVKIWLIKNVRRSPILSGNSEVGDVLTFFISHIFTPSFVIAKSPKKRSSLISIGYLQYPRIGLLKILGYNNYGLNCQTDRVVVLGCRKG